MVIEYYKEAIKKFSATGCVYLTDLAACGKKRYENDSKKSVIMDSIYNISGNHMQEELDLDKELGVDSIKQWNIFFDSFISSIDKLSYRELLSIMYVFDSSTNDYLGENEVYDSLYEYISNKIKWVRDLALLKYKNKSKELSREDCEILFDILPRTNFVKNTLEEISIEDLYLKYNTAMRSLRRR